jgi:hypothetical protein
MFKVIDNRKKYQEETFEYELIVLYNLRPLQNTPFPQFLRLPRGMRSLFLWGQAQILILKILNVCLLAPPAP